MVDDEFDLGVERIKLAFSGAPNSGKSHMGALFVKTFGGMFVDFGKPIQVSNFTSAAKYYDALKGHALTPCRHVGLNKDQYRFINNWANFQAIVDNSEMIRDSIKTIDNHIPWIVLDDNEGFRSLCAMWCSSENGHKMPNKNDYSMATSITRMVLGTLEMNFNIIMACQVKDKYDGEGNNLGVTTPAFYPPNLEHIANASIYMDYIEDEETGIMRPLHTVRSIKDVWVCNKNVPKEIKYKDPLKVSPIEMLEQLQFDKAQW